MKTFFGEKVLKEYYEVPAFRSKFPEPEFKNIILKGCYPLNPIAAYLLLNISEKVAQNERTLFTFISMMNLIVWRDSSLSILLTRSGV